MATITLREVIAKIVKDAGENSVRLTKVWKSNDELIDVKEALARQDELIVRNWRTEYDPDWYEITVEIDLV